MTNLLLGLIYLAFISLGLPDALLGAAWPSIYPAFGVPVSWMGAVSMIIALGTVVSSLQSDRLTRALGPGRVTAISVGMTAAALLGFSLSGSFWQLCLWAVPYGLGAGSVDAALNNYVALHYESRHMSWLHCMWGIGAAAGPSLIGLALTRGQSWQGGYRIVSVLQIALTAVLLLSLPLWKRSGQPGEEADAGALPLRQVVRIPGAWQIMTCFFCYSAVEQTAGLWASSYLTLCRGVSAGTAAGFASLFYLGITAGRAVCGFLTFRLSDARMIRLGQGVVAIGVVALALPGPAWLALGGFALVGLGCAPIYPSIIHATPAHFGPARSQAMIGVQMASAYVGTCLMPPLFGLLASRLSAGLLPLYLLVLLALMIAIHESLLHSARQPAG